MSMMVDEKKCEYLVFTLGNESCAVDIARIQNVIGLTQILNVPHAPSFIRGLTNLRGHILPVIDLRKKFIWAHPVKATHQCILVLEVTRPDGTLLIGVLADSVREMITLAPDDIWPTSRSDDRFYSDFFCGVGRKNGEPYLILDADRIFSETDMDQIENVMLDPLEECC